jgi:hypothetical protein
MLVTQTGACLVGGQAKGDIPVHFVPNRSGALLALATAGALCGCANVDFDTGQWFQKPVDFFGRQGGYTYTELQTTRQQRPITARDLVQPNGSCPPPPAAPQAQSGPGIAAANAPGLPPATSGSDDGLLGGGIALGMSECDVVYRAGQPSAVQIGRNPNGERAATLTFDSGPRPGLYRFEGGRLTELDSVAETAAPAQAAQKKPAKAKKPAKNQQAQEQ